MPTTHDVTCIGNAIVDIIARVEPETIESVNVTKGAMTLVELDQSRAIYDALSDTMERSGGSAGNTAAALAALGRRAAFIGKVKDDQFGEIYAHDIRTTGCTFAATPSPDGKQTGRSMIMVTPDADRTMCTYLGTATDLGPSDLDKEAISGASVLYLEGYLWDKPAAKEAFREAMRIAHEAERRVALTLSDPFCVDRHRESFKQIMDEEVDIIFANEEELLSLYETDDFERALVEASNAVAIAAVTRSEKGATIISGGNRHDVPADDILELVDTTGAGDLFAAGFLNGITTGRPLDECARMGCAAAGVVIQQLGARCDTKLVERFRAGGWLS